MMLALVVSQMGYKVVVVFLAGLAFAIIFRGARALDISSPTVALFATYASTLYVNVWAAALIIGLGAVVLWASVFRRFQDHSGLTLLLSVAVLTVGQAATTIVFSDRIIALPFAISWSLIPTLSCVLIFGVALSLLWRTAVVKRLVRAGIHDSDLARAVGSPIEVMQPLLYGLGVVAMFCASIIWASQVPIKAGNSISLVIYGLAVGGWGRDLAPVFMALASAALVFSSLALSYLWGPLFGELAYLISAVVAVLHLSSRQAIEGG